MTMLSASPTPRTSPPTCPGSWPATPAATPTGTADPTPGTRPSYRYSQPDKYFFATLLVFFATFSNIFSQLYQIFFRNFKNVFYRNFTKYFLTTSFRYFSNIVRTLALQLLWQALGRAPAGAVRAEQKKLFLTEGCFDEPGPNLEPCIDSWIKVRACYLIPKIYY